MPDSLDFWLEHIERIHPRAIEMGLERVDRVRIEMGLHPAFPVFTVGGTNGKGSVCAMLEAILHHAGYRVGCYTSPHLLRFNERIRIGRKEAEDEAIVRSLSPVDAARGQASLTYFEFSTLAAVKLFCDEKVDVAILEVGLGGRLDAVNVFDADCAVITGIDYDHMEYLGETREEIGFEKAGILRKLGVCADPDMPQSVIDRAGKVGAKLLCLGRDFGFSAHAGSWDYRGPGIRRRNLPFPALKGEFQLGNASAALAALDSLGMGVGEDSIRHGLADLKLPGRFQVLPGSPAVVLDVAHNPQAAGALSKNLSGMPCRGKTIAIFAMLADKDIEGVIGRIKGNIDEWLVFGLDVPRGAGRQRMELALEREGVARVKAFSSLPEAWNHACAMAHENDRIAIFGSFHTVADFMRLSPLCERD